MNFKAMRIAIFLLVLSGGLLVEVGCSSTSQVAERNGVSDETTFYADSVDFIGVHFKRGEPKSSQAELLSSLSSEHGDARQTLGRDLRLMKSLGEEFEFAINGYTDDEECSALECTALSLRRAEMVRNWLVKNGAPKAQIKPPAGHGSKEALPSNASESGRSFNRRVAIDMALRK